jgi:diguanylate cyclase (GGDEF)-like protein
MADMTERAAPRPHPPAHPGEDLLDPRSILTSIQEVVYDWRIDTDMLRWSANVGEVLRIAEPRHLASGRAFLRLLDPASPHNRFEAVFNADGRDRGAGVPYQVQYAIRASGREAGPRLWIEDTGRWFAGPDGRPLRAHGVMRVVNERHEAEQRLAFLGRFDPLTGQLNRACLSELLERSIAEARRVRGSVGLLLAAIDNLGTINDAYGFEVADEVIAGVARRIRSRMRGGDGLGRVSGNKFGIIINHCEASDMPAAAQRFLDAVSEDVIPTHLGPIAARLSVGGVLAPRHAHGSAEAMNRAQEALSLCKATRRGGFLAYAPSGAREEARRENARLTDEIVSALNDQRIILAYEPIVDATARRTAACECLVRLRRPDGTIMPASAIVPISEKLGLVRLIDHRVLELAIADLGRHPEARFTINLSAATAADHDWLAALALRLHHAPGVASRLVVEITESAAIADLAMMSRFVRTMRDYGAKVAIDDFGAGHTSFRALRDLGVDMVKIDGAFVQNMARSPDDRFFVRTLIDLARHLGLEIVAEWVGDEDTARQLTAWGCHYLQGHHVGRASLSVPWPAEGAPADRHAAGA